MEKLGLSHLLGTSLMRAYMHGYFVDNRLWHKAKSLAEPFAYDTYRQQRVQQKLEQERKSRIGIVKKLPKVSFVASGWYYVSSACCKCQLRVTPTGSNECSRSWNRSSSTVWYCQEATKGKCGCAVSAQSAPQTPC